MRGILILGYGNSLRGDDGVGWRAAERLREAVRDPAVEIAAVDQLTPEWMEAVSRVARVIFIDACRGTVPGEVREFSVEADAAGARITHDLTPEALLAGAKALYGNAPPATMVTVTGADFSLSEQLSPAAQRALDQVVRTALRLIEQTAKLRWIP